MAPIFYVFVHSNVSYPGKLVTFKFTSCCFLVFSGQAVLIQRLQPWTVSLRSHHNIYLSIFSLMGPQMTDGILMWPCFYRLNTPCGHTGESTITESIKFPFSCVFKLRCLKENAESTHRPETCYPPNPSPDFASRGSQEGFACSTQRERPSFTEWNKLQ